MTKGKYRKDMIPLLLTNSAHDHQFTAHLKWKWPSIVLMFWIVSMLLGGFVYLFIFFELSSPTSLRNVLKLSELTANSVIKNRLNGYLINTPGCKIPDMDPFDSSVKQFVFRPQKAICDKGRPPLFESNLTSIYMNLTYLSDYIVTNTNGTNSNALRRNNVKCCYKEFWREMPKMGKSDNQINYSNSCFYFNTSLFHVNKEFIKVICENQKKQVIYEDYFSFVPSKKKRNKTSLSKAKPNILIIGLDAVSRVNFQRQLPHTHKYLTKNLGAYELLGYNKVGDNTFPNLIPVLTGMFEKELTNSCWPTTKSYFDGCPFLWKNFSQKGYVTAFGEDCAWIGVFNYLKKGFIRQPTDYYFNSFTRKVEEEIGSYKDFNCYRCVGGREPYKVTLDYIQKFLLRMKMEKNSYFGFFWGSALSHDYLNNPALGDQSYLELLKLLSKNGHLDNTVLIFMSDHGIRWGGIRQTFQGQLEERLPFVFIGLPKWFGELYNAAVINLHKNVRRLTTPFDLHETLKDLLDLKKLLNSTKGYSNSTSRGYSLFTEIPAERTCEDAEIASHWCTCQQSNEVLTNDTNVLKAAELAVSNINSQLKGYGQCATLNLSSILSARVSFHDSKYITDKKSVKDYTVTLKTTPGEGVFEVTIRCKEKEKTILESRDNNQTIEFQQANLSITGTISRLNLYGKQSYCITDFHLKLYCYCKSLLNF